jgi:hypothetical protein
MLLKFLSQEEMVSRLAGEPIPILGEDQIYAPAGNEVPQRVETGPVERSSRSPVLKLRYDLNVVVLAVGP